MEGVRSTGGRQKSVYLDGGGGMGVEVGLGCGASLVRECSRIRCDSRIIS